MDIKRIICVCTGNICRSPLAELLLARALPERAVSSAGIGALEGHPMAPDAAAIARREGLGGDDHKARQLDAGMIADHDLILVMEARQKDWITSQFPHSRGRIYLYSHWQSGDDIMDPYRKSSAIFEQVHAELVQCTSSWADRL